MEDPTITLLEPETENNTPKIKQTHKLSDEQRTCMIQVLLQHIKNGKPTRGVMKKLAAEHNISSKTVQRLWASTKKQIQEGKAISISKKMKGKLYGREKINISVEEVSAVSPSKGRTIRALTKAILKSKSTVHRMVKCGNIKAHTNSIN
ncbi:unnamed protein product [Cuscuta campestris]|uniref:DUF7769 domain-containing protein n=1 Tax=Cuscuta campestris TaxID=132261 RepID=A0A484L879_9ASTE|nr:unnamed protein product [Cuscuta campestris]